MKQIVFLLISAYVLTGCITNQHGAPYYNYNNGYGNMSLPLDNKTRINVPFGKSSGQIGITSQYGNFRI